MFFSSEFMWCDYHPVRRHAALDTISSPRGLSSSLDLCVQVRLYGFLFEDIIPVRTFNQAAWQEGLAQTSLVAWRLKTIEILWVRLQNSRHLMKQELSFSTP